MRAEIRPDFRPHYTFGDGPDFRPHYTFGDAYPASERAHVNWELSAPVWHTAQMGSTTHREVAKLDRVPLPVEAARVAATGWQVTRTAVRFIGRSPEKGPGNRR
ncbi:protein kinase [Mycobacterium tuberculosis]|nr:protein kinase [Mycobacterium tuberculosis]